MAVIPLILWQLVCWYYDDGSTDTIAVSPLTLWWLVCWHYGGESACGISAYHYSGESVGISTHGRELLTLSYPCYFHYCSILVRQSCRWHVFVLFLLMWPYTCYWPLWLLFIHLWLLCYSLTLIIIRVCFIYLLSIATHTISYSIPSKVKGKAEEGDRSSC